MIGTVYVLSQQDYDNWLAAGKRGRLHRGTGTGSVQPARLRQLPRERDQQEQWPLPPNLNGLFGTTVQLKDGSSVKFDEAYIRESILYPQAKIVAGYDDIMPTFKGLLTEDGLLKVVEYVRSARTEDGHGNAGNRRER